MQQGRSHNLAPKDKFKVEGLNEIVQQLVTQNDYEYDAYGNRLAVSDSDGNVAVYHKDNEGKFRFQSDIKAYT
jgi:YD repeat-containing protein